MGIKIAGEMINSGEKRRISCAVPGTDIALEITAVAGAQPGKTVAVTAGIHGAEYVSILAAMALAEEIKPEKLRGNLLILPVANPTGFAGKCEAVVPEDGKNLNRMFPGDAQGSVSQKLAHFITHQVQDGADFYLDLHGGDLHEQVIPYVYVPGKAAPAVTAAAREAAQALRVEHRVLSQAETGAYNSAAIRGVPSLLIERGGSAVWSEAEVQAYREDVLRVLTHLGLLEADAAAERTPQREFTAAYYPCAEVNGLWFPSVQPGDAVEKGQIAGVVQNIQGETLQSCYVQEDGIVLYQTTSLAIKPGDILIAYGAH